MIICESKRLPGFGTNQVVGSKNTVARRSGQNRVDIVIVKIDSATAFVEVVGNPRHGILSWIKRKW